MKGIFVLIFCIGISFDNWAQNDTQYYYLNAAKQAFDKGMGAAQYHRKVYKEGDLWYVKDYFVSDGNLQMSGTYKDEKLKIKDGVFYLYSNVDSNYVTGLYKDGKREGLWKGFSNNGMLTDSGLYKNGKPYLYKYQWFSDGIRKSIGIYNEDGSGTDTAWYVNGKLDYHGSYTKGHLMDEKWVYYYKSGSIASIEVFQKGKMISCDCFSQKGKKEDCGIDINKYNKKNAIPNEMDDEDEIGYADVMPIPKYSIGKYLRKSIKYPFKAFRKDVQGRVLVQFVINEKGKITDVKQASPKIGSGLDEEAVRVVSKMPPWKPATQHHRPVKVYFTLPITFRLE